jgi:isoquinoline 1-oxidoreductase beta subunit
MKSTDNRPAYALVSRRGVIAGGLLMAFAASRHKAFAAGGEEPSLQDIKGRQGEGGQTYNGFAPGGFIRISRDQGVTLIMPNVEMGQGIYTAESMLIAEELEIGLDQIHVEPAPPDERLYQQPLLKSQSTGGSTSVRGAWVPLRQAGAAARTMLIAAAAQQWGVPVADCSAARAVVTHQPTGRTIAYGDLAEAAARQPVPQDVKLKDPKDFTLIGKSLHRVDTAGKVDGSAQFGIDVRVPDMKYAAVTACPTLGGRLRDVDDKPARAVPGVRDVLRLDNAVAVTADNWWTARQGLAALQPNWDHGRNANLSSEDILASLKSLSENGQPIVGKKSGDIEAGFRSAVKRIDAVYQLPFLAHAPMEPINALAHVRPDACEVWVSTQVPTMAQKLAAEATGLPLEKVSIHSQLIGGGFGRRLEAEFVTQAVQLAKQVPYPLKVIWTREEDIQQDRYRPAYYDRISAGLDADGKPVVWTDRTTGGSVMGHYVPGGLAPGKLDDDAVEGAAEIPYEVPAMLVEWVRADPPFIISWWRGVGPAHNVFVVESFIDELAHAAGKDPVEYRLSLLGKNPRSAAVLRRAAERAGWGSPLPNGVGRGVSLHDSFGSHIAAVVEVEVAPTGEIRMRKVTGVIDCGQTVNPDTVKAQLEGGLVFGLTAALYNDITFKNGRVQQSNFNNYRMLRINETPPFQVEVMQNGEPPGGVGETGTVSAKPALGNAIFAATGKRLRRYPFRPEDLRGKDADRSVVAELSPASVAAFALLQPRQDDQA